MRCLCTAKSYAQQMQAQQAGGLCPCYSPECGHVRLGKVQRAPQGEAVGKLYREDTAVVCIGLQGSQHIDHRQEQPRDPAGGMCTDLAWALAHPLDVPAVLLPLELPAQLVPALVVQPSPHHGHRHLQRGSNSRLSGVQRPAVPRRAIHQAGNSSTVQQLTAAAGGGSSSSRGRKRGPKPPTVSLPLKES